MRLRTFGGLWIEELSAAGAAPRPRPLALLAILAVAGPKGVSRDRLLGVLWPDAETERARHALSQTIYSLRKDLGAEVVQATPDLRLDESLISSDVAELRAALRAKDWRTVAALYVGPFLEGFYLADAPEFERWVETERSGLATDAMRAIESLGRECAAAGQVDDAAEFYRRLTRLDPMNSRFAIAYMEALNSAGDRTSALAHGKAYGELVQRELDVEPDAEMQRVIARLREVERVPPAPRRLEAPPVPAPTPAAAPATVLSPPVVTTAGPPRATRRRVVIAVAAVAAIAASIASIASIALSHRSSPRPPGELPVIAVGRIRDLGSPDSAAIGGVLSEMLATSLGRLNDLEIIANSRMLELTPRNADTLRSAVSDAARRAGATELIEGELIPLNDRRLRLDIRRIDITRGVVLGGYQLSGTDRIALFDSAAALIAGDFRLDAPTRSLAEVSTRSPIAYRLYEEGLRAFYQYDAFSANRLFRSAVREDSSFAMAMYYAWRAAVTTNDSDQTTLAAAAMTLASRASEHDGLLIRTHVGVANNDPRAVAAAETLATRYPRDPEALIRAAEVAPDLAQAVGLLNRSIALDSAASARSAAVCRLCDALSMLAFRYSWADSLEAAARTLERWTALRPNDALPWASMSDVGISLGRRGAADAADRRATALGGVTNDLAIRNLIWDLRGDDLDAADAACAAGLAVASGQKFAELRWYCTIALRMEGRYREALALVREGRVPRSTLVRRGAGDDAYSAAILDFEMGRPLIAADEFHALANAGSDSLRMPPGTRARTLAWALTLTATAAAAGGDTLRARGLVDSIQTIGAESAFPRDPLLHRFVRGLLFAREDQHEAAAQELRGSIASPTNGYTRANYELGRELLVLRRPAEGIPVVRAALRGGIEGSGLYVTRTEMHELLARLFDAAGQRDSAAAHYAIDERSWRSSDPFIAPRRDAAKQWLARAGR